MSCEPSEELCERGGDSGLLGSGGKNHRSGEAVHAESRDVDMITAVSGELEGEFGRRARSDGAQGAPEVDGGGKRTGSQQDRSQTVGGDDRRGECVGCKSRSQ